MSSTVNTVLTVLSLVVIALIITVGAFYADGDNWTDKPGFCPYGFHGVSSEKWHEESRDYKERNYLENKVRSQKRKQLHCSKFSVCTMHSADVTIYTLIHYLRVTFEGKFIN